MIITLLLLLCHLGVVKVLTVGEARQGPPGGLPGDEVTAWVGLAGGEGLDLRLGELPAGSVITMIDRRHSSIICWE